MPDPTAADETLHGFGRWLARERELRGLSRDEVARATKLGPGVVEALESGQEARMPPRAYVMGYLRAYAAALGLDADEVVLRYEEAMAAVPATVGAAGGARRGPAPRTIGIALVIAAGLAAAMWALLR
ncbi:helix-turn-helix domain-containing protein [Anaeromyxobacter oryzisoli]|uniref:helix-turn-helix domain-containing protein n=1 Tax=Anaeromyxobacter oryzisoli TaxID=2925408 RepID=UPI001F568F80|nr:helix-turn-helix transcriptional regulator [Anaeromyxobacter sp. SG63]